MASVSKNMVWKNGDESYRFSTSEDINSIATMLDDPEVARYLWFTPIPLGMVDAYFRPMLDAQKEALGLGELPSTTIFTVFNEQTAFLGQGAIVSIAGSPGGFEIGFQLSQATWGRGTGTRLSTFLCAYALFLLDAYRIEGTCLEGNAGSRRLLEKLGLELEGKKTGFRLREGIRHNELLYGAHVSKLDTDAIHSTARQVGLLNP